MLPFFWNVDINYALLNWKGKIQILNFFWREILTLHFWEVLEPFGRVGKGSILNAVSPNRRLHLTYVCSSKPLLRWETNPLGFKVINHNSPSFHIKIYWIQRIPYPWGLVVITFLNCWILNKFFSYIPKQKGTYYQYKMDGHQYLP